MRKVLISGMIGNGLEWYDFAVYAYMSLIISHLFFPAGDADAHLLATFGIFAVGFVARPFGGVLFGWLGDKFGRRMALVTSIFMMAIPTGCIGLLPTYAQIGITAPLLLTFLRLLQGLALGGAFSGCITFLVEHAPANRRGLIGSTTISSLVIGFLLGAVMASLVKAPLTIEQYESWGWRIPFLLGVPIGFIGFYVRHHCDESPVYETAKQGGHLSKAPVRDTLLHEWRHVLQAIGIYITVTMPFYLLTAYLLTFSEKNLGLSPQDALLINTAVMLVLFVVAPLSAWLSDHIGRKKLLVTGALAFFFGIYPIFMLLMRGDFMSILLAQSAFAVLVGLYTGPVPTLLVEMFPTRVRYTGMAVSYNIAAAVFGGTAPMACQWLITRTGDPYAIAWYVMAAAALSLVAIYFYRDRHKDALA